MIIQGGVVAALVIAGVWKLQPRGGPAASLPGDVPKGDKAVALKDSVAQDEKLEKEIGANAAMLERQWHDAIRWLVAAPRLKHSDLRASACCERPAMSCPALPCPAGG